MWELIQPVSGPSIYEEFLNENGEGLHHVLVEHQGTEFESAIAAFSARGYPPLMEGRFGEVRFAYMDTQGPLKAVLEIVHRPEGFIRPEPDYWYPAPPKWESATLGFEAHAFTVYFFSPKEKLSLNAA